MDYGTHQSFGWGCTTGPSQTGPRTGCDTSLQELSTLLTILFQCCISIQTQSFSGLFMSKMIDFVWKKWWNTEMKSRWSLKWRHGLLWTQTLQLLVIFVGCGQCGNFKAQFCGENVIESKNFLYNNINFFCFLFLYIYCI